MKLFLWFRRFASFKLSRSASKKTDKSSGDKNSIGKVVKFEDCETINKTFVGDKMEKTSSRNQYVAALTTNIVALSVGASIGWASPFLPVLQTEESPLIQLSSSEASWVGSILAFGALCGTLLFGLLSEKVGRFWALLLTAPLEMIWWLSLIIGNSLEVLLLGRFLAGICAGGVFVLVPLYVSEISDDNIRGTLGSFFIFSINFGTLLMFIAGSYLSFSLVPKLMMALPIIFAFTFIFLPETPQHLLKHGKPKQAEKSLKFLRGCRKSIFMPDKVKNELMDMSEKVDGDSKVNEESVWKAINTPTSRKALIIGLVLVSVNQLSGCFAFINYTAEIFMESESSLSPNMSAIIVAIIQVCGSTISTFVVGNVSRKLLFTMSCFATVVGLLAFGAHGFLKMFYDVSSFAWVPIISLSFVIFVASIGLLPLTFVMLSEILPQNVRSLGVSFCTAVLWTLSFLLLKYFATLVALLELYVCMFIFAIFTFFGAIFVIYYVPETRNKSSDEIERALAV